MTKVIFVDNGIPFDGKSVRKKPVGGAENAFVSLVEELAKLDFEVVVFNSIKKSIKINGVFWKKLCSLDEERFDIVVLNRGDKFLNFKPECKKRFFWIHNPAKYLLKWRYLFKLFLNPTTVIFSSYYHLSTYPRWAPSKNNIVIPYGVDSFVFKNKINYFPKEKNAIFTSNPLRGLNWLLDRWENEIFPQVPSAKLNLFTGSQTYGQIGKKKFSKMKPVLDRAKRMKTKGVFLHEPMQRTELIKEIKKSRLFLYEGSLEETFCMSVAEAQVIGLPTVVKDLGCMRERVQDKITGHMCSNDLQFSKHAINLLKNDEDWKRLNQNSLRLENHKGWSEIAMEWKKILK